MAVRGGKPVRLLLRHDEPRVDHAERVEQELAQVLIERTVGHAREQDAEQAERVVVAPRRARLERERHRRQRVQPLLRAELDGVLTRLGAVRDHLVLQRARGGHHPVPGHIREQVTQSDRPVGGNRVIERRRRRAQHPALGEFGEPALHGIVEAESPVLHQLQRGRGGHGLGHRLDPHDRVLGEIT